MFQRVGPAAYKPGLETTLAIDKAMGQPHLRFKTIHVAGTNGKGSVSHSTASVLQSAGYRTGLYTSPHLVDFRERIRVNGEMISEQAVVNFVASYKPIFEVLKPSFFEITVAMAFYWFELCGVEIAVIETGMGGRLDSTNIINPLVSVITSIGLDHTQFLGDTPEKIAFEKGGIIKPGIPVILGQMTDSVNVVFEDIAHKTGSRIVYACKQYQFVKALAEPDWHHLWYHCAGMEYGIATDLHGSYQKQNMAVTLSVCDELRKQGINIAEHHIQTGLQQVCSATGLTGRWQTIQHNPTVICDTGHNVDGIEFIVNQLKGLKYDQLHIVFGVVADKDPMPVLKLLPQDAEYYFTQATIQRALSAEVLTQKAKEIGLTGSAFYRVALAFDAAIKHSKTNDLIFIGGSTFVVADFLSSINYSIG